MKKISILIIISFFALNSAGQCYSYGRHIIAQADALRPASFSIADIDKYQLDKNPRLKANTRLSPDISHMHFFWPGYADGNPNDKKLLSDKGSGLMRLALENMPVPPGFVIDSKIAYDEIKALSHDQKLLRNAVGEIEKRMKVLSGKERYFGDNKKPLFLSIRAGYPLVEPGKLPTLLNIGLNDETVSALEPLFDNKAELYNMYFMYIRSFTNIVHSINFDTLDHLIFDDNFIQKCQHEGIALSLESIYEKKRKTARIYKRMISRLKEYLEEEGFDFPDDPWQQLSMTIGGIEKCRTEPLHTSLTSKRLAEKNGNVQNIANIAFTVQAMVFGNLNDSSCTGIASSRHPITGENSVYIEMAHKSQGPAVVTPSKGQVIYYKETFKKMFPAQLIGIKKDAKRLEMLYSSIRNIEFTIEDGRLYILQQRPAFVHPAALVHYAIDMGINSSLTYREVADTIRDTDIATKDILNVNYEESRGGLRESEKINHFISLLKSPIIDPNYNIEPVLRGFPLSPGVVTGRLIVREDPVGFLFNEYDRPIAAMDSSFLHSRIDMYYPVGFITKEDSLINHIAELARNKMGTADIIKPAATLRAGVNFAHDDSGIVYTDNTGKTRKIENGDTITIDGNTGNIYLGKVPTITPIIAAETNLQRYLKVADALLKFYEGDESVDIDLLSFDMDEAEIGQEERSFQPIIEPIRRNKPRKEHKGKRKATLRDYRRDKEVAPMSEIDMSVKSSSSGSKERFIKEAEQAVKELTEKGELPITRNVAQKLGYKRTGELTKRANYHNVDLRLLGVLSSRDVFILEIRQAVKELKKEGKLPTEGSVARKLGYAKTAGELTRRAKRNNIGLSLLGVLTNRDVFMLKIRQAVKELTGESKLPTRKNVARKIDYDKTAEFTRRAKRLDIDLRTLGVLFNKDVFILEMKQAVERLKQQDSPLTNINIARALGYPNSTPLIRRANRNKINLSFTISS
ncbi:MAG: PEP/pyruvate-binding domain-containing protein [Candidatus Orphnella occulta]|nr:PEP/pyruvate-binding domain-containing protein [Candidatus Orphnella occulta]